MHRLLRVLLALCVVQSAATTEVLASPWAAFAFQGQGTQRRGLRELEQRADELRAAGVDSGRAWRELTKQVEELSQRGSTQASWWLLEQHLRDDGLRRSRIGARRGLWRTFLENAAQDPWTARSYALDGLVREAEVLGSGWVLGQLENLARETSQPEVKAASQIRQAGVRAPLDPGQRSTSQSDLEGARKLLESVRDEWGAASEWGQAALRALWRLENLRVGLPAPAMRSFDHHGNEINLQDGLGKVCLLHFFGFGAPDIAQRMDRDRALIKKHWDDRFWLIGINEDRFRNRYTETLERYSVDWEVAWEGELERGETTAKTWHLESRAHTFVLDARGVIRAIDPDDAALGVLLEQLVEETRAEAENRKRSENANSGQPGAAQDKLPSGRPRDPSQRPR